MQHSPLADPRAAEAARFVQDRFPTGGLFAGQDWRVAPSPFGLGPELASELDSLGRVLLQFNRAVNLLYRQSLAGKQPPWVAAWLDRGKPAALLELQRHAAFKNEWPRVIRPDILLTDQGFVIVELDAVPGGIGLTAWLNQTYSALTEMQSSARGTDSAVHGAGSGSSSSHPRVREEGGVNTPAIDGRQVIGGSEGMLHGFAGIFGEARHVHIVVSDEAATYRPEMRWLARALNAASERDSRFRVQDASFRDFQPGDAVYRFFELFDAANVANAVTLFDLARDKQVRVTPPPKPIFEEKMLFALLWNRNLRSFWRQELGEGFLHRLLQHVPYTWVIDPTPLPPQAAIPELNLTDWHQLKTLSQRERDLILKVSGFSEMAWGARSVKFGSNLSFADWTAAVDAALRSFPHLPYVLQRYHKPRLVQAPWFDFQRNHLVNLAGRARLCPYYFVQGEGDAARAHLGGVLATICPSDKKIIHGMPEAILAPCCV